MRRAARLAAIFSSPFLLKQGSLFLVIENGREIPSPMERAQLTTQPILRLDEIVCPFFYFPRRGRHLTIVDQNHSGLVTLFSAEFCL
jgi:hypothetical protein